MKVWRTPIRCISALAVALLTPVSASMMAAPGRLKGGPAIGSAPAIAAAGRVNFVVSSRRSFIARVLLDRSSAVARLLCVHPHVGIGAELRLHLIREGSHAAEQR